MGASRGTFGVKRRNLVVAWAIRRSFDSAALAQDDNFVGKSVARDLVGAAFLGERSACFLGRGASGLHPTHHDVMDGAPELSSLSKACPGG